MIGDGTTVVDSTSTADRTATGGVYPGSVVSSAVGADRFVGASVVYSRSGGPLLGPASALGGPRPVSGPRPDCCPKPARSAIRSRLLRLADGPETLSWVGEVMGHDSTGP